MPAPTAAPPTAAMVGILCSAIFIYATAYMAGELEAYNPLIPDGRNWKVTLLVEFSDPQLRQRRLAELKGVEDRCWVQVADFGRVFAIADEDLDRENEEKTSSVHFLRFELTEAMVAALRYGASLAMGVDHPTYRHSVDGVAEPVRRSLLADLS